MITLEQVREALKELVESKPEGFGYKDVHEGWVPNTNCWYVIDNQPACIVGQVAFNLGKSIGRLVAWEGNDACQITGFEREAKQYLLEAQIVQDHGFTWALAYQTAELTLILGTRITNKEDKR